jgi:F420-non-reducing hydrogenase iron-sulfur subunit
VPDADVRGRLLVLGCRHTATGAMPGGEGGAPVPYVYEELECLGALDGLELLRALDRGAAGVLVVGCHEGRCRHVTGSRRAKAVVAHAQDILAEAGLDRSLVRLVLASPLEPGEVSKAVLEQSTKVGEEGGSGP